MNRKRLWGLCLASTIAAAGGGMALGHAPGSTPPAGEQPGVNQRARCEDAARQAQALFSQIKGLEGVLNRKQDELNAAKGTDARLNAAVAMINELADSRVKIREKEEAMRDLLVGHMLEHLTGKSDNRELDLQSCALFKDLHRSVQQQIERGDAAQKRDREQDQPKK